MGNVVGRKAGTCDVFYRVSHGGNHFLCPWLFSTAEASAGNSESSPSACFECRAGTVSVSCTHAGGGVGVGLIFLRAANEMSRVCAKKGGGVFWGGSNPVLPTPRDKERVFRHNFSCGTLFYEKNGIRISPAWASPPQLGLVVRCGGET